MTESVNLCYLYVCKLNFAVSQEINSFLLYFLLLIGTHHNTCYWSLHKKQPINV